MDIMADDDSGNPSPEDIEASPTAPARREEYPSVTRQPRAKESWEPQARATRRPDFAERLAKTTDLPGREPLERPKSSPRERRAAAIDWEQEQEEERRDGSANREPSDQEAPAALESPQGAVLSRGQIVTLAALGVVVAVLGVMWFAKSLLVGRGAPALPPQVATGGGAEAAASLTDADYAEAIQTMRRFLEALKVEDLRPVLREPDRVWPLVEDYQRRTPWKPFVVRRLPTRPEIQLNRGLLAGVVEVNDFQRFVLAMERAPEGVKVDWESFTGQGEMPWEDFLAKRPSTPVLMRVTLRPDDYYNRDFPDAATHACFRLAAHQDAHLLYGYAARGTPVHEQLVARTRATPRILPTLRLRFPAGAPGGDQVEITELVADGWIVTESTRVRGEDPAVPPAAPAVPPAAPTPPK
jgi:hypothetical protein